MRGETFLKVARIDIHIAFSLSCHCFSEIGQKKENKGYRPSRRRRRRGHIWHFVKLQMNLLIKRRLDCELHDHFFRDTKRRIFWKASDVNILVLEF